MAASIRASYTKLGLRHFRQHHADALPALQQRVGEETLQRIREASSLKSLPAELHAAVAKGFVDTLGQDGARQFWRDVMLDSFGRDLLAPLIGGAVRIYGNKPSSIMRMTPQGWTLVFNDCGRAWMEEGFDNSATMRFDGLPSVIARSEGIIDSFAANCDAALVHTKLVGQVTVHRRALLSGELAIEVTW